MRITCPTCRLATTWEENAYRPFCSERCRMIDLGAWATEQYRVPAEPERGPAEERPPDENI